jgi:hypothetical protein
MLAVTHFSHDQDLPSKSRSNGLLSRRTILRGLLCGGLGALIAIPAAISTYRRWRRADAVSFTLEGPFHAGRLVWLPPVDNSFVKPRQLRFFESSSEAQVTVEFVFAGAENPNRRIGVEMILKDAAGHVLSRQSQQCEDLRPYARQTVRLGSFMASLSSANLVHFPVAAEIANHVKQLTLRFEEV